MILHSPVADHWRFRVETRRKFVFVSRLGFRYEIRSRTRHNNKVIDFMQKKKKKHSCWTDEISNGGRGTNSFEIATHKTGAFECGKNSFSDTIDVREIRRSITLVQIGRLIEEDCTN